ncbi:group III truncated hemoglobin [Hymenobacter rubripertinctus]|uniref:Group III truncated hemoglobin n=1 Tax=Hymenobacter rubripertinctus TaxID=2029981 RepID=A0A418R4U5_9BACT|nr:group III truncated hemoglobin [Hymenobacter rubripertinctus]RIY12467.1 group III truncated hemoglobin [Hymenobacter rubripertinctus]
MVTSSTLPDLRTEGDIKTLVDTAFSKATNDELLAPLCQAVAQVHWPRHLTSLYDYWSSALLGTTRYQEGQMVPLHSALPLRGPHQQRWADLLGKALEEKFAGSKAEEAKGKAAALAAIFRTA